MDSIKTAAILILAISILTACSPKYYVPNTQHVPLLSEKGEVSLTAGGNANQAEVQVAYAVSNSLGIMGNVGFFNPKDDGNGNGGSGRLGELGLGYFKPIGTGFIFETYGLIGFGSFENHFPTSNNGKISGKLSRYGIQPSIGYKTNNFSIALSSRLSSLHYGEPNGDLVFDGMNQIDYLKENDAFLLLEPALTIRAGLEKVKLQVQLIRGFNLTDSDFRQDESLLSVGVNINVH
ncbi:MAG: hypothetical protein GC192_16860 [Bacteroidetes bacterium]|nr:hypothetical protein [Bacteroidota bacterium]